MSPAARLLGFVGALLTAYVAGGCSADGTTADPGPTPEVGQCRQLSAADLAATTDDSPTVPCAAEHTAESYLVGRLPDRFAAAGYDDAALSTFVYRRCSARFERFVGADESLAMRTVLSWVWYRPTLAQWEAGARWYRCDVVGGGDQSRTLVALPSSAHGLLLGKPDDRWLVCADGAEVEGSVKVPCTEAHTWRAVTTIVLGERDDPYPGDQAAESRTRDYCSDSVGAWLNYPVTYDFAYTWFHEAEWEAGNRRSVCWAKTPE